jgi:hypothetical protein
MADRDPDVSQHVSDGQVTENVMERKTLESFRRAISKAMEKTKQEPSEFQDAKYPEGGLRAWLVVLGSWCAMIPSMGLLNTIGILHAWTGSHQLAEYSSSSLGWIFGAFSFFLYFGGAQVGMDNSYVYGKIGQMLIAQLLVGPIFDSRGVLPVVVPGSIGIILSIFFFSASTGRCSVPPSYS